MNNRNIVMAGIVTFNPDIDLLRKNIIAVSEVLKKIYIVDNGSKNIDEIDSLVNTLNSDENITVKELGTNLGIAKALNIIMEEGEKSEYNWVLTLDQDSIVPNNIISENMDLLNNSADIAIVSAVIADRNVKYHAIEREEKQYSCIEYAITSASITSVDIWRKLKGFDEWMFIDQVDVEYCGRARKNGFKIVRNNNVRFSHAIGNIREIKIGEKWITVGNHSAFRKYYLMRNLLYMSKKLYGKVTFRVWREVFTTYIKAVLFESDKINKIKSMHRGFVDGMKIKT